MEMAVATYAALQCSLEKMPWSQSQEQFRSYTSPWDNFVLVRAAWEAAAKA